MTKSFRRHAHRQRIFRAAFITVLAFSFIAPSIARAQAASSLSVDIDNYVRSEMQRQHIPGVALLVSRGGKIVQAEGFGLANVDRKATSELQSPT